MQIRDDMKKHVIFLFLAVLFLDNTTGGPADAAIHQSLPPPGGKTTLA